MSATVSIRLFVTLLGLPRSSDACGHLLPFLLLSFSLSLSRPLDGAPRGAMCLRVCVRFRFSFFRLFSPPVSLHPASFFPFALLLLVSPRLAFPSRPPPPRRPPPFSGGPARSGLLFLPPCCVRFPSHFPSSFVCDRFIHVSIACILTNPGETERESVAAGTQPRPARRETKARTCIIHDASSPLSVRSPLTPVVPLRCCLLVLLSLCRHRPRGLVSSACPALRCAACAWPLGC